ncbi:hypothetical protein SALBM311S_11168 [Streptomyces alboniger]
MSQSHQLVGGDQTRYSRAYNRDWNSPVFIGYSSQTVGVGQPVVVGEWKVRAQHGDAIRQCVMRSPQARKSSRAGRLRPTAA